MLKILRRTVFDVNRGYGPQKLHPVSNSQKAGASFVWFGGLVRRFGSAGCGPRSRYAGVESTRGRRFPAERIVNDCFPGSNIFSIKGTRSLRAFTHARLQVPQNQWDRHLKSKIAFACDWSDERGFPRTKPPSFARSFLRPFPGLWREAQFLRSVLCSMSGRESERAEKALPQTDTLLPQCCPASSIPLTCIALPARAPLNADSKSNHYRSTGFSDPGMLSYRRLRSVHRDDRSCRFPSPRSWFAG